MSITWDFDDRFGEAERAIRAAAAEGLTDATEALLTESNRTVPIEEATLERSGTATVDRAGLEGAASYDTPYAVVQHEDMDLQHDDGRRAKWLESTIKEQGPALMGHVAERIRRATS